MNGTMSPFFGLSALELEDYLPLDETLEQAPEIHIDDQYQYGLN